MTDLTLRTHVSITYRGKNITEDVTKDIVGFSYTDNESGTADDISLTLKNNHGLWTNEWLPTLGDKITAVISQTGRGSGQPLACGVFTFDEYTDSYDTSSGSTVTFNCQSVPSEKSIKSTKKSKGWESVKLSEIAGDIAKKGSLKLTYATKVDPLYDRKSQSNISDLQFLKSICESEALNLKITDDQIVIFDPQEMDKNPPVTEFIYGESKILSRTFTTQSYDTYSESTVEYSDPKTGTKQSYTEKSATIKDAKPIKTVKRVTSKAEAERIAKAKLYQANKKAVTGAMTVTGDTQLAAGAVIQIIGFGKYDGLYKITKATHSLGDGYTTALELENTQYPPKNEKETKEKTEKVAKKRKTKKATIKPNPKQTAPVSSKALTEDEKWIMNQK